MYVYPTRISNSNKKIKNKRQKSIFHIVSFNVPMELHMSYLVQVVLYMIPLKSNVFGQPITHVLEVEEPQQLHLLKEQQQQLHHILQQQQLHLLQEQQQQLHLLLQQQQL